MNKVIYTIAIMIIALQMVGCSNPVSNMEITNTPAPTVAESNIKAQNPQEVVEQYMNALKNDDEEGIYENLLDSVDEKFPKNMNIVGLFKPAVKSIIKQFAPGFSSSAVDEVTNKAADVVKSIYDYEITDCNKIDDKDTYEVKVNVWICDTSNMDSVSVDELLCEQFDVSSVDEITLLYIEKSGLSYDKFLDMDKNEMDKKISKFFEKEYVAALTELFEKGLVKHEEPKPFKFTVINQNNEWKISGIEGLKPESSSSYSQNEEKSTSKDSKSAIDLENYNLNTDKINENDLTNLSKDEVRTILNALYAYHGYEFTTEEYKNYFKNKTWYHSKNKDMEVCESEFNDIELYNKNLLVAFEKKNGWR